MRRSFSCRAPFDFFWATSTPLGCDAVKRRPITRRTHAAAKITANWGGSCPPPNAWTRVRRVLRTRRVPRRGVMSETSSRGVDFASSFPVVTSRIAPSIRRLWAMTRASSGSRRTSSWSRTLSSGVSAPSTYPWIRASFSASASRSGIRFSRRHRAFDAFPELAPEPEERAPDRVRPDFHQGRHVHRADAQVVVHLHDVPALLGELLEAPLERRLLLVGVPRHLLAVVEGHDRLDQRDHLGRHRLAPLAPVALRHVPRHRRQKRLEVAREVPLVALGDELQEDLLRDVAREARHGGQLEGE